MQNQYDGILQFKGKWRVYQERVLTNAETYLSDHKVHIVAAPGSGKTTLGIELIRRLGAPCLILSPSITIRQQWLERITDSFLLPGNDPTALLSNDLKQMKTITAITYQALYSAMKQMQGQLSEEDETEAGELSEKETVDFRDFRIFDAVRAAGIRTICLDEAHHLRSEWWKALESFLKELNDVTVISLTATPPYDSTPGQWKRYTDLCGPIDEEIFTPELVREGSLCPHEDYICFNWPSPEEQAELEAHRQTVSRLRERLLSDPSFSNMIASHKGLQWPEEYSEQFLDNPRYFSSLLIFCEAQGIPFSKYLRELIGTEGKLPKLTDSWLETLLQGFLFDDADSYQVLESQRQQILAELKEAGCISRKKVSLTQKEAMEKLLAKSRGKLDSIRKITETEYRVLGSELRLLILCDFIKKDKLPLVGTDRELSAEIGAVPIFEFLRRKGPQGIRLGCLSGTVVILPTDTRDTMEQLLKERGCEGTLSPIGETGYGLFQVRGKSTHVVAAVTELFRQGGINTLVGTKSLLGEGWDAPCINSLILATYVGSFMLSNQMRGRTIRTDREHPEKTGNIWHLACVFPEKSETGGESAFSGDYETLIRRFDSFLGVSWKNSTIESGIDRMDIPEFDSVQTMEEINQMMLDRAADREGLRTRWQEALSEIHGDMEINDFQLIPEQEAPTGYVFVHALGMEILSIVLMVFSLLGRLFLSVGNRPISAVLGVILLLSTVLAANYGVKLFRFSTPERRMKQFGQAVVKALVETGQLDDSTHCKAEVSSQDGAVIGTWLSGGSMRDKTTFADCMGEIWGIIDNPRYLLMRETRFRKTSEFYAVPDIFGKQKERALVFEKHMRKVLGSYRIQYTRTPEGRKLLLRARTRSFVNRNQSALLGKKVAKGTFE